VFLQKPRRSCVKRALFLKGFERITLAPGESRTVRLTLGPDAFALWNLDMDEVVEPGLFDIMVGPDSENLQTVTLEIL